MHPNLLRARVEAAIKVYIDWGEWERSRLCEEAEQKTVREVARARGKGSFWD